SNLSHISFRLSFRTEAAPQRLQLAAHAAVVYRGTDARHHAADEGRGHREAHANTLAGEPFQLAADGAALAFGEFARRGYLRPREAQALVHNQFEAMQDFTEERDAPVVDQDKEKIERDERELKDVRDTRHDGT